MIKITDLKEKKTETAEHIYDLSKKELKVDVSKNGIKVSRTRPTKQTIKWRAKNH